ncbi:MAG TPA: tRNA uridine-5-carboxymethylaminomethyl(34) synthesis GTPase MnmE [Candidatus Binataceae bacterium]|nr:tRNA uridine-5-carboxymethylaminomethyl(34) synthesis GTPase MnmE [Candidatus Binataceae bacterium]
MASSTTGSYPADTIVAPATPPGAGAVAIVRLSGPRAIAIARALWHSLSRDSADLAPRQLYLGEIRDSATGVPVDRAMLAIFPAPRSLTGEDVAELQCHGGVYLVRRVLALATAAGARLADPGEFSRRAFLNGRIDLTEAEATADLVAARGEAGLRMALAQLSGALAARITNLRRQVIAIRAHLEAEIDFADEDIRLPSRADIVRDLDLLAADLTALHDSFARGRIIREGARAAIIGKPNAGKSSVLNLLLGADRAIVTAIPGTTRDVIEDSIAIAGLPLVLADTAGLRDSTDAVERLGIERTRRHASESDLVIAVFDSSRPLDSDDARVIAICAGRRGVAILNKRDLPPRLSADMLLVRGLELPLVECSAITSAGLPELRALLEHTLEQLAGGDSGAVLGNGQLTISRERHRHALRQALDALAAARHSALSSMPPEIVAVDVMAAADALGSITGIVSTENVLDALFREFCIGK